MPDLEWGWRQRINDATLGLVEVDALHPFRRFYGLDASGRAQLVFLSDDRPPIPPISDLVAITRGRRESDQLWALSLSVADERFTEIFVRLGADLARRSEAAQDSATGLALIMTGLDEWRRLLSPKQPQRLSDEQLRGLVGEVWTADHFLNGRHRVEVVVDGWLGPFGHPQDFSFLGSGSLEVKAVRPGAKTIRISSAEQLDAPWGALELVVVTLEDARADEPDRVSLAGLAGRLRERYVAAGRTGDDLDVRFKLLGVDLGDDYYSERFFRVRQLQIYHVTDSFPALRASALDAGVRGVRYEIDRSSVEPYLATSRSYSV